MTRARTLADMISDGVIGTTELADDVITPVKLDETGSYEVSQLGIGTNSASSFYINDLVVGSGSGTHGISIYTSNTTEGVIRFADGTSGTDQYAGQIKYKHDLDSMTFHVNATSSVTPNLSLSASEAVFNEGANNIDFRIESSGSQHMLFVDASETRIGINQSSPLAILDIKGDTTTYGGMAKIYLTDDSGHIDSRNWSIGNGGSAYGSLTFGLSNNQGGDPQAAGTHTNPLVITKDSLVGINSPNPVGTLDIASSGQTFAHIRSTTVNAAALRIQASDTGTGNGDGLYIGRSAAVNYLWTYENEPLVLATDNLERMRINADGQVTKPYQPSFSGRGLVPVNINSYAQLNVNLGPNTVMHNTGNHFNTSTNQFTCPVAGKYWVYSSLLIDDDSGTSELIRYYWFKNGSEFTRAYDNVRAVSTGGRYEGMVSCGAVVDCAANDILYMRADSGALHTGFESNFSIYFLG